MGTWAEAKAERARMMGNGSRVTVQIRRVTGANTRIGVKDPRRIQDNEAWEQELNETYDATGAVPRTNDFWAGHPGGDRRSNMPQNPRPAGFPGTWIGGYGSNTAGMVQTENVFSDARITGGGPADA